MAAQKVQDVVDTAWNKAPQRDIGRASSKGRGEVRKLYEAAETSMAPASNLFGDIHNFKEEVAQGGAQGPSQTMVLQKKFSDNVFGKIAKNKYFELTTIS
ncbi:unnamed protein product, partial [Effrenium voratum]